MIDAEHILAECPDPLIVLDATARILLANTAAEKFLDRSRAELVGTALEDWLFDSDTMKLTGFESSIQSDIEQNVSLLFSHPTQECVHAHASIARIGSVSGTGARYILILRDIKIMQELLWETSRLAAMQAERASTAEEAAQRQMAENQARKLESIGQLAAGVAHEINTPIQFMSDNLLFLRDSCRELLDCVDAVARSVEPTSDDAEAEVSQSVREALQATDLEYLREELPSALEQTLDGANRVAKIVRAMKDFAHPSDGVRSPMDLEDAITMTTTLARSEWRSVADVQVSCDADMPPVPCVPDEMKQVFLNLLVNACHAIEERVSRTPEPAGRIRIAATIVEGMAEIRYSDNGAGIPAENLSKIYDPFFTTKGVGRGTGQGLSLAYSTVVKCHHGSIDVESKVGEGTTFVIRLPLVDSSDVEPSDIEPRSQL